MDTMSAVTLMHCENGWISIPDIVKGLTTDLDVSSSAELTASLTPLLNQFANLDLLEQSAE